MPRFGGLAGGDRTLNKWRPITAVLVLLLGWISVGQSADAPVLVEIPSKALVPGDLLQVRLHARSSISRVECSFLEQQVLFYPLGDGRRWEALAGVDLEIKPGLHSLTGTVWMSDGRSRPIRKSLRVLPKKFPTQRIRVNQKYVTLNPRDSERAAREHRQLTEIWQSATAQRMWEEPFVRPVSSRQASGFGRRRIVNGEPRSPHSGVDLRATTGTPIRAANAGRVVMAKDLFFAGNTIILDHGLGLYTVYAHCSKMRAKPGDQVAQGQIIGEVGATGRVTGPHLHWACRINGARVNPVNLTTLTSDPNAGP
ncbi:MAG: M23 family metallopeptidase [Acidobacteria bacterium]|nr:M23 family metallopeptidase [Acidobacteriota bacterium]